MNAATNSFQMLAFAGIARVLWNRAEEGRVSRDDDLGVDGVQADSGVNDDRTAVDPND
jgi:hypothetical protein